MRCKWHIVLVIGLALLLTSSIIGCSTTAEEVAREEVTSIPFSPRKLNIIVSPPGAGVVSTMVAPQGGGVIEEDFMKEAMTIVPPEGKAYERNTPLMLEATPNVGYSFAYWEGDRFSYWASNVWSAVCSSRTWWLIMNNDKVVIAQFTEISSPISEVTVSAVTESKADIRWVSPLEGYSQIEYGPTEKYGSTSNRSEGGKGHSYTLHELEPEMPYHFRIIFVSKEGAEFASNDYVFTTRSIEELVSAVLYPVRTVSTGDSITHFGSTLFNDSSQTITVYKMTILNEPYNTNYAITETGYFGGGDCPSIMETWGSGEVISGESLSMSGWVWEPPFIASREYLMDDILEWQVEWYCEAANGEKFTVKDKFSSYADFFNWLTE